MKRKKTINRNPTRKLLPTGQSILIYNASEIAKRKRKKLSHCRNISDSLDDLIKTVTTDIRNGSHVAAVIGVILCTYERVGNAASAAKGHYGASNLLRKHVIARDSKSVTLRYVAKSGVTQEKCIHEPVVVKFIGSRLRISPNSRLFDCAPLAVNQYLAHFGITSKDIRTYAANKLMEEELQDGEKFTTALKSVASIIGHNPATLKNMYLHDKLKEKYAKR